MPGRFVVYGQRVQSAKREAARRLRQGMTSEEKLLWGAIRGPGRGGPHFRRQQVIDGFIVDFYSNVLGLVIEVDGDVHQEQKDYDRERDRVLLERGLIVLHFTNDEIRYDLERVMNEIATVATRAMLGQSAPRPSPERGGGGGGVS